MGEASKVVAELARVRAAGILVNSATQVLLFLFPCFALLISGCELFERDRDSRDPLLNIPRRAADERRSGVITSNPGDNGTPAGLAGSRDGVSGLSIRERTDAAADRGGNVQPSGWTGDTASNNGGARLNTPSTSTPPARPSQASPVAGTNVSTMSGLAPRVRSFEDAQQYLMAHGVRWQRLQQRAETKDWLFECTVPNRSNPTTMRNYEANDQFGLVAIQKVLDNIARDQAR